jgi:hypothetical protein
LERPRTGRTLQVRLSLAVSAVLAGSAACNSRPTAPAVRPAPTSTRAEAAPKAGDRTTFSGTITGIDIGDVRHPYLRWVVTVRVDEVLSGHRPGDSFWFAIHSPSQEGLKVGRRLVIRARKTSDGYEVESR